MNDIEKNTKILNNLKKYLNLLINRGQHKIFYNDFEWDEKTIDCINAIEHILAERKQDKARIKELEEDSIPVQKVKDKIKELSDEFEKINTPDNNEWYIDSDKYAFAQEKLEELLEDR